MAEDEARASLSAPGAAGPAAALADPENPDARDYLRAQTRLADLQSKELRREDGLRHWSLRVRHISDVLKLSFELALALIVIAIAAGLGTKIWAASRADGLVIESFAVPPAMADKGLTGQVVASKLLDRLAVMQDQTQSSRAASSFANNWTNDIKVEIPDTGVSLGEVVRYLHGALGHEMHLSGEIYETPNGATLTVRVDSEPGQTFASSPDDLDGLIARAAEAVYARAQPYRYSVYLYTRGERAKASAVDKALAEKGPARERAWAYIGLSNFDNDAGRYDEARRDAILAHEADPLLPLTRIVLVGAEAAASHEEAELAAAREAQRLLQGRGAEEGTSQWNDYGKTGLELASDELTGSFLEGARLMAGQKWFAPTYARTESALDFALAHDPGTAERMLAALTSQQLAYIGLDVGGGEAANARAQVAIQRQNWREAVDEFLKAEAIAHDEDVKSNGYISDRAMRETLAGPNLAIAYAHLGEQAKADAVLRTLPADCDLCTRTHGRVEAIRRHWAAAARWFALVSARAPSIPFADSDWGAMLLAKGDLDGAIAKFESAHEKGPHFADPLEMWGEALIARNRSDLALAKFEEAGQYALNWARLHRKWGEALSYLGRTDEAKKQFALARSLDG